MFDENMKENNNIDSSRSSSSQSMSKKSRAFHSENVSSPIIKKVEIVEQVTVLQECASNTQCNIHVSSSIPALPIETLHQVEDNGLNELKVSVVINDNFVQETPLSVRNKDTVENEFPTACEQPATQPSGSLEERLKAKMWSTRRDAYDSLKTSFVEATYGNDDLLVVQNNIKGILSDSHNNAQTSGVEMILEWVSIVDAAILTPPLAGEISSLVVEKCFPQTGRTQTAASNLLISLSRRSDKKNIVEQLIAGCKNKKKKVPPGMYVYFHCI
jgi:hypothetical protein